MLHTMFGQTCMSISEFNINLRIFVILFLFLQRIGSEFEEGNIFGT